MVFEHGLLNSTLTFNIFKFFFSRGVTQYEKFNVDFIFKNVAAFSKQIGCFWPLE